MNKVLAGLILLVGTAHVSAGGLDLALSNQTANLAFVMNTDPFYSDQGQMRDGGAEMAFGAFVNEAGDEILHAMVLARGVRQSLASQYQLSVGMKLVGGEINVGNELSGNADTKTVGSLALGFQAGLLIRPSEYNPVELTIEGFYAPSISSFADATRYGEVSARLQVEIMARARAYIGYRRMRFNTKNFENVTLDRSAHFGLSISF